MYYQRLKDLREDKDLNQKDIAIILKTTQQTYSLWERGDREIPLHHAITLSPFGNPMQLEDPPNRHQYTHRFRKSNRCAAGVQHIKP